MTGNHNPFSPVLAGAMARFRGKWVDGEIFGKEDSRNNGRYCLFTGECEDPFAPDLQGSIRVIGRLTGGRYRTLCALDFRPAGGEPFSQGGAYPQKRVELSGYWDDVVPLKLAVDSLLASSPDDPGGPEPAFWFSGLPDAVLPEEHESSEPEHKIYRRRPRDIRERARHFPGKWLELDESFRRRRDRSPEGQAAFSVQMAREGAAAEVFIARSHEGPCRLGVGVSFGESVLEFYHWHPDFSAARSAGLQWAGFFNGWKAG